MSYYQWQNCLQLGKINSLPIKLALDSEKQWEHSNTFPPPSALHSWLPYPLMGVVQRDRDRGLWLFHNNTSLPLLPPHTLSLIHRRVFSTGCHCCRRYASALVWGFGGLQGGSLPWHPGHFLTLFLFASPWRWQGFISIFFLYFPPSTPHSVLPIWLTGCMLWRGCWGTFRNIPELSRTVFSSQRPHIE